jgi:hypothetical protein
MLLLRGKTIDTWTARNALLEPIVQAAKPFLLACSYRLAAAGRDASFS